MTAIVLRAADARVAAALSGMAQGIGYLLAAGGPLLVGFLRGVTGSYASAVALFCGLGLLAAVNAYGAGRALRIGGPATQPPG
ncbi:MAG: cyanate transporter, partial [Actinomycetospora chiangmaiensis]|nr:cyanate transporter [Actinomycetospora chiangmaiensis]